MKTTAKRWYIILFLLIFGLTISCSDDDNEECLTYEIAPVTSVNSPTTGVIDEPVNIEVNFEVTNGCGDFGRFIEELDGDLKRIIQVEAQYVGCACTQEISTKKINYTFIPPHGGNYELKFSSSNGYITVNITVS